MSKSSYIIGAQMPNRALLIHVTNAPDVVKSQGTMAAIAQGLAPDTIDEQVYMKMADQLKQKMAEQGVKVDIKLVDTNTMKLVNESQVWRYATYGLAGALGLGIAGFIVFGGRGRSKSSSDHVLQAYRSRR